MNNVSIDIETMGNTKNAAIVSIGAAFFNLGTEEIGETFYADIDLTTCMDAGMELNADTIYWWMRQSEPARDALQPNKNTQHIGQALADLHNFLLHTYDSTTSKNLEPWGNGSGFDLGILDEAFKRFKMKTPWNFWNERDMRTIVKIGNAFLPYNARETIEREGTHHNAVDDAIYQGKVIAHIWNAIKK